MSFTVETLEQATDFSDALKTPKWIVGEGQKVGWRSCFVHVFVKGNTRDPTHTYDRCDGQGTVPRGTELYFGGNGGRVKTI